MDSKEFHLPTGLPITLNADEWDYLAEGNEHMIFKYNGNIPNFIGTVIRVRKVMNALPVKLEKREFIMEHYLQEHYLKELVNEYCFKPHPVIGDMTKINILDVKNKDEFIMKLIERNENARPEFRRKKTINPETNFELIFDYTFSLEKFSTHTHRYASLSLEIKPKCAKHDEISFERFKKIHDKVAAELGIAADSYTEEDIVKMYNDYASKEGYEKLCANGHEDRVKFTRFFKTQLKKQQEKKVEGFTRFDPHDFFHQDIANIKKAFKQLLETPQNNLKVFAKGVEVKPEDHKTTLKEILEHFLQLTHAESEVNQKVQTEQELLEEFGGLLAELFKATEMIGIIEMFQDMYQGSSLAMLDILQNLEKQVKETNYELTQDKLMEIVKKVAENKPHNNNGSMDIHDLIETVIRFLISIAFRDCSIILSLQFLPHEELEDLQLAKVLEEKGYKTYNGKNSKYKIMYTAGLVDFHMKGINHAYSHPVSTKELFGLLIKHLYEIKTNGEKST